MAWQLRHDHDDRRAMISANELAKLRDAQESAALADAAASASSLGSAGVS